MKNKNIVQSSIEPSKEDLWFKEGDIKYFGTNGWDSITDNADRKELETKVDELDKEMGEVKADLLKAGSTGGIVELSIGDTAAVKKANLEKLAKVQSSDHTFITHIDYGFGSADWLPTVGGSALISTADGHEVYYKINKDGSVVKDDTYIKPDTNDVVTFESNIFASSSTYQMTDEVYNKVIKASVIRIKADDGRYESYFWRASRLEYQAIPFTTAALKYTYFYTIEVDKGLKQLVQKTNARDSTDSAATKTERGSVKAAVNVADVTDSANLMGAFNQLLANLRAAGIIIA